MSPQSQSILPCLSSSTSLYKWSSQGLNLSSRLCASLPKTALSACSPSQPFPLYFSESLVLPTTTTNNPLPPDKHFYLLPCFPHSWESSQTLSSFPTSRHKIWKTTSSQHLSDAPMLLIALVTALIQTLRVYPWEVCMVQKWLSKWSGIREACSWLTPTAY